MFVLTYGKAVTIPTKSDPNVVSWDRSEPIIFFSYQQLLLQRLRFARSVSSFCHSNKINWAYFFLSHFLLRTINTRVCTVNTTAWRVNVTCTQQSMNDASAQTKRNRKAFDFCPKQFCKRLSCFGFSRRKVLNCKALTPNSVAPSWTHKTKTKYTKKKEVLYIYTQQPANVNFFAFFIQTSFKSFLFYFFLFILRGFNIFGFEIRLLLFCVFLCGIKLETWNNHRILNHKANFNPIFFLLYMIERERVFFQ